MNPRRVPDYDEGVTEKGTWVNVAPREEALDNETKWSDGGVVRNEMTNEGGSLFLFLLIPFTAKKKKKGYYSPFFFKSRNKAA